MEMCPANFPLSRSMVTENQFHVFPRQEEVPRKPHHRSFWEDKLAVWLGGHSRKIMAPETEVAFPHSPGPFTKPLWSLVCSSEKWGSFFVPFKAVVKLPKTSFTGDCLENCSSIMQMKIYFHYVFERQRETEHWGALGRGQ